MWPLKSTAALGGVAPLGPIASIVGSSLAQRFLSDMLLVSCRCMLLDGALEPACFLLVCDSGDDVERAEILFSSSL
jgi:hypothetical protein